MVILLLAGKNYEAEICVILLPLRYGFHLICLQKNTKLRCTPLEMFFPFLSEYIFCLKTINTFHGSDQISYRTPDSLQDGAVRLNALSNSVSELCFPIKGFVHHYGNLPSLILVQFYIALTVLTVNSLVSVWGILTLGGGVPWHSPSLYETLLTLLCFKSVFHSLILQLSLTVTRTLLVQKPEVNLQRKTSSDLHQSFHHL